MVEYNVVISPCISICHIDKQGICKGCFRTVDEISNWYVSPQELRQQFKNNAEERKKAHNDRNKP